MEQSAPGTLLRIDLVRGYPFHRRRTYILREQFIASGLGTPALRRSKQGRPFKAQGTLGHYVDFAEMLMQIGCLALALLVTVDPRRRTLRLLLALALIALTAALFLTETRAAMGGLAVGGFLSILLLTGRKLRIWAIAALILFVAAAALWIYHTRGSHGLRRTRSGYAIPHHDVGGRLSPDRTASLVRRWHGDHPQSLDASGIFARSPTFTMKATSTTI